ncbi:MAG TPA: hypothetical protein PK156_42850 [Polyangium sp.]|nr:hypothetical protein [Polyangium sp.]
MARRTKHRLTLAECKWRTIIAEWRDSGLSGPEFCEGKGLNVNTLHVWSSKLKKMDAERAEAKEPPPPSFLPVEFIDEDDEDDEEWEELDTIDVHLASGDVICVPGDCDMQQVAQIVAILRKEWQ